MKTLFSIFFAFTISLTTCSQNSTNTTVSNETETTTYYFIRHAEKDRTDATNKNPNLNESGLKRANKWANYFKDITLDAIYSTNYNRTQQTAQPTAKAKKLDILDYNPRALYTKDFANATKGKTVLVVGHSNTTPAFVNMVLGNEKYKNIDDNDNSQLFIVTISEEKTTDEVISIN